MLDSLLIENNLYFVKVFPIDFQLKFTIYYELARIVEYGYFPLKILKDGPFGEYY